MNKNYLALFSLIFLVLSISLVSSSSLKVTQEHPFYLYGKWIEAKDLKIGDNLTTIDGKQARITSIEDIVDNVPVYNLETELYHNFVVGDENLIVHNSDQISCPSKVFELPPLTKSKMDSYNIDPMMRPLIARLWKTGYVTEYSCSGHYTGSSSYISIRSMPDEFLDNFMARFGLSRISKYSCDLPHNNFPKEVNCCDMCGVGVNGVLNYRGDILTRETLLKGLSN